VSTESSNPEEQGGAVSASSRLKPAGEAGAGTSSATDRDAFAAETKEQVAAAETRRVEEEEGKAEEERKAAEEREKKLEREQAEAKQRQERAAAEAEKARGRGVSTSGGGQPVATSGATATAAAGDPFADLPFGDRPEIQAGIAFGATFIFAKILKAIGN
jgi:hypothetical protein